MTSITDIFEEITALVSANLGMRVNYLFGDWPYISATLAKWSTSKDMANLKYPAICLFSPYQEDKRSAKTKATLEFLIMTDTIVTYTNEQRREESFKKILIPIYNEFIKQIGKCKKLDPEYNPPVPHVYTENYRWGRLTLKDGDGNDFRDKIDAIEIKDLIITLSNKL